MSVLSLLVALLRASSFESLAVNSKRLLCAAAPSPVQYGSQDSGSISIETALTLNVTTQLYATTVNSTQPLQPVSLSVNTEAVSVSSEVDVALNQTTELQTSPAHILVRRKHKKKEGKVCKATKIKKEQICLAWDESECIQKRWENVFRRKVKIPCEHGHCVKRTWSRKYQYHTYPNGLRWARRWKGRKCVHDLFRD